MLPYFSLLFTIAAMTLFDGKKVDKLIFFVLVMWMFIFSALRIGGTGEGDYNAYQRFYLSLDSFDKVVNPEIHVEIGFRFLSFLGNSAGFSEQYIIICMAFLSLLPVVYVIYRYSPYKILSLLIWMPYFLTMNMHSSRTSVAAAFGLLFIVCFYKRKNILALLSFLVALSFHSAAWILLLVLLVRVDFYKLLIIVLFMLLMLLFTSPLEILMKLLNSIGVSNLSSALDLYLHSEDYGYPMAIYDPRVLLSVGILVLIFQYKNRLFESYDEYYFKIYLIGVILMILFSSVVIMSWRLSYYFLLIGVIVIPYIAKSMNMMIQKHSNHKRVISFLFTILYCLYAMPIILQALPYKFIIEVF